MGPLRPSTRDQPSRLTLSMLPSRLPPSRHSFPRHASQVALGVQPLSQAPFPPPSAEDIAQRRRGLRPWVAQLAESRAFFSPASTAFMAAAYNVAPVRTGASCALSSSDCFARGGGISPSSIIRPNR